jgi:hypothetical protein
LAATLIAACSDAVPGGRCVPVEGAPASGLIRADVLVSWPDPSQERVVLQITIRREAGPRSIERVLTFQPADEREERWRAAGFAAGALVGVQEALPTATPGSDGSVAEPKPPRRGSKSISTSAAPTVATAAESHRHRPVWLGIGGQASPGLSGSGWRFGGWFRGDYDFEPIPMLVGLSGSFAASPRDDAGLRASWVTIGAGTGLHLAIPAADLELRARVELFAEWLGVSVQDELTGLEDSGSRWTVGPRMSLHGQWPHDSLVAGVLGASAWTVLDHTVIEIGSDGASSAPWGAFSLDLGVRLAIP